jgi:hypothetical protein
METQKQARSLDSMRIEELNDGFLVEYPILSLDLLDEASFNFCSSVRETLFAPMSRAPERQTLLSEEAFNILKWRGMPGSFLPCPYFRKISLGSLTVELLPSGEGGGSSFLHVTKGTQSGTSLLYAHNWSLYSSRVLRAAAPKPADELVLRLRQNPLESSHTQDKREIARFLDLATKLTSAGEWVVAVLPSLGPTQMIASELHSRGVDIYLDSWNFKTTQALKVDEIQEGVQGWIHAAKKLATKPSQDRPGIIILSKEGLRPGKTPSLPNAIWCCFDCDPIGMHTSHLATPLGITFSEHFAVKLCPDITDILALIENVKPRHVTVAGPGATAVTTSLARHGLSSSSAASSMLTLF